MRRRYALGLMVVLAACGGHAADVARTARTQSPTTAIESVGRESSVTTAGAPTTMAGSDNESNTAAPAEQPVTPEPEGEPVDDHEGSSTAQSPALDSVPTPDLDDIVLQSADIPGWGPEPHEVPPTEQETAGCGHLVTATRDRVARAGRTFVSPDGERELSNDVSWYRSDQAAAAVVTTVDRPATVACLERLLTGDGDAFTVDRATVERRALSDGDLAVGYQAVLAVNVGGTSFEFVVTIEYVQVDHAVSFAMSFAPDRVADEAGPAFDAVVRRLTEL